MEKCPARAATSSTLGWGSAVSLAKCKRLENGVDSTTSSRTSVSSLPTITWSIPKGGRSWVRRARPTISSPAASRRVSRFWVQLSGNSPRVHEARPAQARAGAVRSRCAW